MFDLLATTASAVTVSAVYRALLELFELDRSRDSVRSLTEIRNKLAHSQLPLPEKDAATGLAFKILEEVEKSKKKQIYALSEAEVKQISRSLTKIVEQKLASEAPYDKKTGKAILEELRKEYSSPASVAP